MAIEEKNLLQKGGVGRMTTKRTDLVGLTTILSFLKENVYNISEVTRQNKLGEILESFAGKKSEEVFVIQNSKKKEARGILLDEEFFLDLLQYKHLFEEALDKARDEIVFRTATERLEFHANISLAQIINTNDLDVEEMDRLFDEVEIE